MGTANKLRTYREHTLNYTTMVNMVNYLQAVLNFKHRKALSKLKVGDHKLNIEVGRHTEIPLSERICTFCNVDIVVEKHFLLKCTVYEKLRETLFGDIVTYLQYFQEATTMTQFKILFNPRGRVVVHAARFYIMLLKKITVQGLIDEYICIYLYVHVYNICISTASTRIICKYMYHTKNITAASIV